MYGPLRSKLPPAGVTVASKAQRAEGASPRGQTEQLVAAVFALDADVDVTRAGKSAAGANVAPGQAGTDDGDLDADRVLAWPRSGAASGHCPQDGLGLVTGGASGVAVALVLAPFQRGAVVQGITQAGVGAVGEKPQDAGGPSVHRREVQRQPSPFRVRLVDRGVGAARGAVSPGR
jgi:hypothetical protein